MSNQQVFVYLMDAETSEVFRIESKKKTDGERFADVRARLKAAGLPMTVSQSLVISKDAIPDMLKRRETVALINGNIF